MEGWTPPMDRPRPMRKTDLIAHFVAHFAARGVALRRGDAREFLDELHRVCVRELKATGEFALPRVAKFALRWRRTRTGRNPRTGGGASSFRKGRRSPPPSQTNSSGTFGLDTGELPPRAVREGNLT